MPGRSVRVAARTFGGTAPRPGPSDARHPSPDARPNPLKPPPSGPQPFSATSRLVASRLVAPELGGEAGSSAAQASEAAAAGERLVARVTGGLGRSFGPYGALALVSRALTRAHDANPVLSKVTVSVVTASALPGSLPPASIAGLSASGGAYDASEITEGVTSWLAHLVELLGGLIGDELAATLLEQSATPSTDTAATPAGPPAAPSGTGDARTRRRMDQNAQKMVDEP